VLTAGGYVSAAGGASLLDREALSLMNRNRNSADDHLSDIFVRYGEGGPVVFLAGGLYVAGLVLDDRGTRETGLLIATSVAVSGAVVEIAKVVAGRARPFLDSGPYRFKPLSLHDAYHSLPSGHASAAFAISAVLSHRLRNPWATAGLYGLAVLTAVARMYQREHWFSDVVSSALLSTAVAHSVTSLYEEPESASASRGLLIVPQVSGLRVLFCF
jgi:membrane-associated phospholipid phosphatase